MKSTKLTTVIATALVVGIVAVGNITVSYIVEQQQRTTVAIQLVRKTAYYKMLEAEADGDMKKLSYYRWTYYNADKVVADFGVDVILDKEKKH